MSGLRTGSPATIFNNPTRKGHLSLSISTFLAWFSHFSSKACNALSSIGKRTCQALQSIGSLYVPFDFDVCTIRSRSLGVCFWTINTEGQRVWDRRLQQMVQKGIVVNSCLLSFQKQRLNFNEINASMEAGSDVNLVKLQAGATHAFCTTGSNLLRVAICFFSLACQ